VTSRVSTFGQSQVLLQQLLRQQENLSVSQRQVSTGKVASDFKGLARDANALASAKAVDSRNEGYLSGNKQLEQRLEIYNSSLGDIADIAETLRQDMIQAVGLNSGKGFMDKVTAAFQRTTDLLQTKDRGQYIFSGSRTDTPPVNATTTADFLALPNSDAIFENNQQKGQARVDDARTVEFGVLADETAGPLMNALYRILQFNSGTLPAGAAAYAPPGAFGDPLTGNQRDFLVAEFQNALAGVSAAREQEAANGVRLQSLGKVVERQEEDRSFIKGFIADIEDVDVAQAITKLNGDQTALEASLNVAARLSRVSLLDYI
jgi:flagellar hook-associated protein 3 FlgL